MHAAHRSLPSGPPLAAVRPAAALPPASSAWLADALGCGAPLAVGLLVRIVLAMHNSGLTMDSPLYVNMADALARDTRVVLGPAHHGYPALVALTHLFVPGREWPGRLVALVAGLALIALIYALARRSLSPGWSALAAALVALHPLLAVYSGAIMTETAFLAVAYAGILLVESRRFAAGGAVLGLSYWVRPEALVITPCAALPGRAGRRGTAWLLLAAVAATIPYLLFLRWEYGQWRLTPKDVLVAPVLPGGLEQDFSLRGVPAPPSPHAPSLVERARAAAPSVAAHYLPNLRDHAAQLLIGWPWPLLLLLLALVGLAPRRGAIAAPLPYLVFLPLLAVKASGRFPMVYVPALAVLAAAGAAAVSARFRASRRRLAVGAALALALLGLGLTWGGPSGRHALFFNDGPMAALRAAGSWLGAHGKPGALVADRKPYVPFYAGMRAVPLPGDDYETVLRWAMDSGVDYIVLEEYTVLTMRRNLLALVTDPEFRAAERRLRIVYAQRNGMNTGVWIFAVVRDAPRGPAAADPDTQRGAHSP